MTVTAETFKARFPEFASVSDDLINLIISERTAQIGETWIEADRDPALRYLVAHLLSSEGYGTGGSGGGAQGPVKRRKVGDVETEFAVSGSASTGSTSDYLTTSYGREYYRYLRRNFPAVAAV